MELTSWESGSPVFWVTRASPATWWVACQNPHVGLCRRSMMKTGLLLPVMAVHRGSSFLPAVLYALFNFDGAWGTEGRDADMQEHITIWAGTAGFLLLHAMPPEAFCWKKKISLRQACSCAVPKCACTEHLGKCALCQIAIQLFELMFIPFTSKAAKPGGLWPFLLWERCWLPAGWIKIYDFNK